MSFSGIENGALGKLLQISFSEGVRSQISADYSDWEQIKMNRIGDPNGREHRFLFQKSYGPGAVQYRNPNFSSSFPGSQQITVSEHSAVYKELEATIEIDYNLWFQLQKSPAKYADQLGLEIQSKAIALKRRMAADLYGDGTGCIMTASAVAVSGGQLVITVDSSDTARGHLGFCEYYDNLSAYSAAAAYHAPTVASGTVFALQVRRKDRPNNQIYLTAVDAAGNDLTVTAANTVAAADVFYRGGNVGGASQGQPTIPDLTAINSSTNYGTLTEVWAGLESLAAADGRNVHGITMSGLSAGTEYDCGNNPIDVSYLQAGLDQVKINVGPGAYAWKRMGMAPESHAAFVESRETDRRFTTKDDAVRGIKVFGFQHGNDFLESYSTEYIPRKRLWCLPEQKAGQKVMEWQGTDFEPVRVKGSDEFMLKPGTSGGHERRVVSYMHSLGVMICKHPASVLKLRNFTA